MKRPKLWTPNGQRPRGALYDFLGGGDTGFWKALADVVRDEGYWVALVVGGHTVDDDCAWPTGIRVSFDAPPWRARAFIDRFSRRAFLPIRFADVPAGWRLEHIIADFAERWSAADLSARALKEAEP